MLPRPISVALFVIATLNGFGNPSHAGWSPTPVVVRPLVATLRTPMAVSDSSGGAFVAWCEDTVANTLGVLRAQHLLASGDRDPAWPSSGRPVRDSLAARTLVRALSDEAGGLYLAWLEGMTLYVQHILGSGALDARWPARGVSIANVGSHYSPSIIEDGVGGLFVAWAGSQLGDSRALVTRLNADGTTPTAWRVGQLWFPHVYVPGFLVQGVSLARSGDGGAFLAFDQIELESVVPPVLVCTHRVLHLTAQGQTPDDPIELARRVAPEYGWRIDPHALLASDGSGGCYCLLRGGAPYGWYADSSSLLRLEPSGQIVPDWPNEGVRMGSPWTANEPLMIADGMGGVAIGGVVGIYTDTDGDMLVRRFLADGSEGSVVNVGGSWSATLVADPLGGFHAAASDRSSWSSGIGGNRASVCAHSFVPGHGPAVPYEQFGTAPNGTREFGDVGLAPAGDGGCIVFYVHDVAPAGLVAIRLAPSGQPLDVAPVASVSTGLAIASASWRDGVGTEVRCVIPAGSAASLALFDVAGRRLGRLDGIAPAASPALVLPGCDVLSPGVYFARLTQGARTVVARIAVLR